MSDLLFDLPTIIEEHKEPNPMVQCYGRGPSGAKCSTCKHLFVNSPGQNKYFKCRFRKVTHGTKTDHRARWNACSKYEEDDSE